MRILVKSPGEKTIWLAFPTAFLFNRFTASLTANILPRFIKMGDIKLSPQQAKAMLKAVAEYRRKHGRFILVDVQASDGTKVLISI
ncbi:MAG: hypothetical protein VB108_10480 [Anaerolineaceae bacterium]|nr:hypothetical protein [Anaerolineaceae bacterium]